MFEAGRWRTPEAGTAPVVVFRLGRIDTLEHRARWWPFALACLVGSEGKCMRGGRKLNGRVGMPRRGKGQERNGPDDSLNGDRWVNERSVGATL